MSLSYEKKRSLRRIGPIIDRVNIGISIAILFCAVFILFDIKGHLIGFPIMFSLAALMNAMIAFKCYKMAEISRMLVLVIAVVMLIILSIIGFIVTL